jgi:hypothetical protein
MELTTLLTQIEAAHRDPEGVNAMVEQMAAHDPAARLVAQFLRQRQEQSTAPRHAADGDRLARRIQLLREAYDRLYALVLQLAQALGACPRCWGEGPECPMCNGNGAPGAVEPSGPAFDRYVRPALRRMHCSRGIDDKQPTVQHTERSHPQED